MKSLTAGLFLMAAAGSTVAQTLYFPTNVPSNWSAANGSLAISTNHYKVPSVPLQCLQWNYGTNDTLTVTNPGISAANVTDFYNNTCDLWVYNPAPLPGQKVTFQFVDSSGTAQYYFDFYLNYSGWRHAVRSYIYDMNGPNSSANFDRVRVVGPTNVTGQLFFDAITWVGPRFTRVKDAQNVDITGYLSTTDSYHCYNEMSPDILTNMPTASELADLAAARSNWLADNAGSAPSGSSLSSAYASWTNLNIVVNGTNIMGSVINDSSTADNYYSWLSTISQDIYWNNGLDSSNKMNLFLRNWWDQGMDYNSEAGSSTWYSSVTVPKSFILGYNSYDAATKEHLRQMFLWMYRMGGYWSTNWMPGQAAAGLDDPDLSTTGTDDIYLNTRRHLGAILFLSPDDMTAIQYLKGYKRYIERYLTAHNGTDDGLKADGCGFHHGSHYNSYMYSFNELSDVLYDLSGTQFEVNSNAYLNLRGVILAEARMGNSPDTNSPNNIGFTANSLNGRHPFQNTLTPSASNLQRMGVWGGSVLGQSVDPVVAQVYNRLFGVSQPYATFASYGSEPNPEGFYQFNNSPIGVYRQTNWVATMHGMNNDFWGSELFPTNFGNCANIYGRYQSYGALEILYPGGYDASGWDLSGWDWNKPPGTTTIVLPWANLVAPASSYSEHEYSATNFAGGLAFHSGGNTIQNGISGGFGGLYACNFLVTTNSYEPTPLAWRKSWFCFSNQILCLGSNIKDNDAVNPTITTLFQSQLPTTTTPTVMNGTNYTAFPKSLTNNDASADWLLDGQGTGYFVRPGSPIRLDRTAQVSPDNAGSGAYTTNNYATAWINHGTAPNNSSYEYVVVPNTTSNAMAQLATNFTNSITTPYSVLECDATAHVVQWKSDGRIGYALYATNALLSAVTNAGALHSVSLPCLAMIQPVNGTLWLTVVNPDINLVNNFSTPTNLIVTIAGNNWVIAPGYTNMSILSTNATTTTLQMQTVNGFPVEALLLAVSNSLTPPLGVTATAVTTNQINVTWLSVSNATGYIVQRGGANITNVAGASYNDTGLSAGTTYTYTVLATNAGGTSLPSQPASAKTPTLGTTPTAGAVIYWDADFSTPGDQDGSGTWNSTSLNWLNGGGNVSWVDNCTAVFGAGPTTNCVVTLANNIAPSNIIFSVTGGGSYTIAGNNTISTANGLNIVANGNGTINAAITGSKGLTNIGGGTLTLSGTNTYTGGTTVTNGIVNVNGDQSAANGGWTLISGIGDANFNSGSKVVAASGKSISVGGNSSSGNTLNVSGTLTNNGTLSVGRRGTANLNSGANWLQNGTMNIADTANSGYSATFAVNSGATCTYTGSELISVSPSSGNGGWGILTIAGGTFNTGQGFTNAVASSSGMGNIAFSANGTLKLTANVANLFTTAGSANSVTLGTGGGTIDTAGFSTSLGNVITGSGGLTKLGSGTLTLTASNTCNGGTIIGAGTLALSSSGSIAVSSNIIINAGATLDVSGVSGSYALVSGQKLVATSGATATVKGSLNVSSAAVLMTNAINTPTVTVTGGAFTLGGSTPFTVNVNNGGTPLSAGSYKLISVGAGGSVDGTAPSAVTVGGDGLATGATVALSVSNNELYLAVTGGTLTPPTISSFGLTGGQAMLSFTGPNGQTWKLLTSTNVALPLASWSIVTTGTFNGSTVYYTNSTPTDPHRFYIVTSP